MLMEEVRNHDGSVLISLSLIFSIFWALEIPIFVLETCFDLSELELNWPCILPHCFCVFCVLCSCVLTHTHLPVWLPTYPPFHLPFDLHSSGVTLVWSLCVIHQWISFCIVKEVVVERVTLTSSFHPITTVVSSIPHLYSPNGFSSPFLHPHTHIMLHSLRLHISQVLLRIKWQYCNILIWYLTLLNVTILCPQNYTSFFQNDISGWLERFV